jgi:hypothetical protein
MASRAQTITILPFQAGNLFQKKRFSRGIFGGMCADFAKRDGD